MARSAAEFRERLDELTERAERDRAAFDPPETLPDEERAMAFLHEGLGPVVVLYLEARTGKRNIEFAAEELDGFDRATNAWLSLYAACYGVEAEFDVPVRNAAELLVDTEDIRDTAEILTRVPRR